MTRANLRGPIATLWDGDGADAAWAGAEQLVNAVEPDVVQIHAWDPRTVLMKIHRRFPRMRWVMGVGVDTIARRVALGEWTIERGANTMLGLARVASELGAEAIVWNAEAAWKRPPSSGEAARIDLLVRTGLAAVAQAFPALRQWHTAYDHPSLHSTYPWRAWLGAGSPIEASFPQVYAAPGDGLAAHRGALPRREARALASWASAVRAGWIRPDAPAGSADDARDVDWRPYYQLHSVALADTVQSAVRHELVALWALRSRSDRDGRRAYVALSALNRLGYWGEGAVRRFQSDHPACGKADDVYGPLTEAELLMHAGIDRAAVTT